jgi:hypothetical protein
VFSLNFCTIFVVVIENRLALNIAQWINCSLRAKVTGEHETFFCRHLHDKICVLEVFIGGNPCVLIFYVSSLKCLTLH